ncbi:MAG: hypothetical protein AAFV53_23765 [Myxococcota bacterium]
MVLEWDVETDGTMRYANARIAGEDPNEWAAAMAAWWTQLCEHALEAEDWDTIVADLWIETGRLIGHVQRSDQAVGNDRGFRVCLTFLHVSNALYQDDFSATTRAAQQARLDRLLDASIHQEPTRSMLMTFATRRPLRLWWCMEGAKIAIPDLPT